MNKTAFKGSVMLLVCAAIWGFAFSAQDLAAEHVNVFTCGAVRSLIATLVLALAVLAKGFLISDYGKVIFSAQNIVNRAH